MFLTSAAAAQSVLPGKPKPDAIRVTPNPAVFATLCALYTAGYPVAPAGISPQLQNIVSHLGTLKGPAVVALRTYYRNHRMSSDADTLASYMSFAMLVGPPPSFQYTLPQEQLPPDVRSLSGFRSVLTNFYREEKIGALWDQVKPAYESDAAHMMGPVSDLVSQAVGYSREMNLDFGNRTFSVYVDPLVGSQTNFRIYSESYGIAVSPSAPSAMNDVRLAFLHFLLDPLPFNNLAIVESKAALLNFAVHAPRLPAVYKQEFVAFTAECLVRAVDLRLRSLSAADLNAALAKDDRDGYILVRPLYEALEKYQSSTDSLETYFPTLIESINVKTEAARDRKIAFAPAAAAAPPPPAPEQGIIAQWLDAGDQAIASRNGPDAATMFSRVLQLQPKNTRAQYGLAIASVLNGDGELADQLFEQIVQSPKADPSVLAWSHVYLGRMNDVAGHRQDAVAQYKDALGVSGAPAAALAAAKKGIQAPFSVPKSDSGTTPHP